jgi:ATP-dependent Lhr-like helicase
VDSLRLARRQTDARANEAPIAVAAADPLNLVGILVPGERVAAVPGREVEFQNGVTVEDEAATEAVALPVVQRRRTRSVADMLRAEANAARAPKAEPQAGLFQ